MTSKEQIILNALAEKLGKDIVHIDLRHLTSRPTESFIICHGRNERQVEAMAREVIYRVKQQEKELPLSVEGLGTARWVVIDYFDTMLHIFRDETLRQHYDLEGLWHDGKTTTFRPAAAVPAGDTSSLADNANAHH